MYTVMAACNLCGRKSRGMLQANKWSLLGSSQLLLVTNGYGTETARKEITQRMETSEIENALSSLLNQVGLRLPELSSPWAFLPSALMYKNSDWLYPNRNSWPLLNSSFILLCMSKPIPSSDTKIHWLR